MKFGSDDRRLSFSQIPSMKSHLSDFSRNLPGDFEAVSVVAHLRFIIPFGNQPIDRVFNLRPTNCTETFSVCDNPIALDVPFKNAFSFIARLVFETSRNFTFVFEIVPPLLIRVSNVVPIHAGFASPLSEL